VNTAIVSFLVNEVRDYFDAGRVGLYEFVWILRGSAFDVPEGEYAAHALAALDQLLADGSARIVWRRWADPDYEKPATRADVDDSAWDDPTDQPYLAVVPSERQPEGGS
jgi:hypothetical protein